MKKIAFHDETGMRLFPTQHAEVLVDRDYIMASLGVLSKKHKEGAKRLLERSLGISFPKAKAGFGGMDTSLAKTRSGAAVLEELERDQAAQDSKREALIKHIKECEAKGYDMAAYREGLGLPSKEKD